MATNITAITAGTPVVVRNAGPKQFQALFDITEVQVTLTDATNPAQGGAIATIAVPGVEFGDFVLISYPADLGGQILQARVKSAGNIEVITWNVEGTDAVTTLSGGLVAKVLILKPKFGS